MKGTIARLVSDKGFGFITGEDGKDRFFHRSGLQQSSMRYEDLYVGQLVEAFTEIDGPKGPRAIEVLVR